MSTKIFEAWRTRFENTDLFSLMEDLRARAWKRSLPRIEQIILRQAAEFKPDQEPLKGWLEGDHKISETRARLFEASQVVYKNYLDQLGKMERNSMDLTVNLCVYRLDKHYYFLGYADMAMKGVWDFLDRHPKLIKYPYWNNTDKPGNLSDKEWEKRGKIWDTILNGNRPLYLQLHVIDRFTALLATSPLDTSVRDRLSAKLPLYLEKQRWLDLANSLYRRPKMTKERYIRWFSKCMKKAGEPVARGMIEWVWNHAKELDAKREQAPVAQRT